tara:strand:- start:25 stop:468 length:444 start_codon:yes stop_codon:yes gene_type:complete
MADDDRQVSENSEPVTPSRKPRRKKEPEFGQMLRDFLQRTGLNDDLEQAAAFVARRGIEVVRNRFKMSEMKPLEEYFTPPTPPSDTVESDEDDDYAILGVHRNTSPEVMKAVYIYWAKNHHPDVGGDEETFKRVNAAWDRIKQQRGF